jgi:beta-galactosidase
VVDSKGKTVPTADNEVAFEVTGPGKVIGVGNGNPSSHEPDKASKRKAFNGRCMVLVQSTGEPGMIRVAATAPGLKPSTIDVRAEKAPRRPFVAGE